MTHPLAAEHRELHPGGEVEGGRLTHSLIPSPRGICHALAQDNTASLCGIPSSGLYAFPEMQFERTDPELQCPQCRAEVVNDRA
ncbi:MAG: hypothetical protein ACRDP1_01950 [Nocardioidaceae bacterium]